MLARTPHQLDRRLVSFVKPNSFEAEQYRQIRRRIEELGATQQTRVLVVTSAIPGDGKTLTAINLAGALAQGHDRVLLIDADLRHPTAALKLGITAANDGFLAALKHPTAKLHEFVRTIVGSSLAVLPGAVSPDETYELLASQRLKNLFDEARANYDFVIVDTPPLLAVPDTCVMRSSVDGYLLVVSANSTPRELVGEALSLLDPDVFVGLVFNRDDRPLFGYYKGYYRAYFNTHPGSERRGTDQ